MVVVYWKMAIVALAVVAVSACAGTPAETASAGTPATGTDQPSDLSSAAAQAFAEAADDGSAAFCAPGRYTVHTEEGVDFAMVSWGDRVQLTLLDTTEGRTAAEAPELAGLSGNPPAITLSHVESASGAKYVGGPDGEYLFWSKGDRATIQVGAQQYEEARVRPLATGR
ncbi:MAG: MliC family protein [Alkalispirochaeta sp.]